MSSCKKEIILKGLLPPSSTSFPTSPSPRCNWKHGHFRPYDDERKTFRKTEMV